MYPEEIIYAYQSYASLHKLCFIGFKYALGVTLGPNLKTRQWIKSTSTTEVLATHEDYPGISCDKCLQDAYTILSGPLSDNAVQSGLFVKPCQTIKPRV